MTEESFKALESISQVLRDSGLEKYASDIDSATFDMPKGVSKWTPSMMRHDQSAPPAPAVGVQSFAQKGEVVNDFDAATNTWKLMLWGMPSPMTMDELQQSTARGDFPVKYFADQVNLAKAPSAKKFFAHMLQLAERSRANEAIKKLASLSDSLLKKGYDTLSKRLLEAAYHIQH
jgi:hypothetical protein